jgi:hypothetical protein
VALDEITLTRILWCIIIYLKEGERDLPTKWSDFLIKNHGEITPRIALLPPH